MALMASLSRGAARPLGEQFSPARASNASDETSSPSASDTGDSSTLRRASAAAVRRHSVTRDSGLGLQPGHHVVTLEQLGDGRDSYSATPVLGSSAILFRSKHGFRGKVQAHYQKKKRPGQTPRRWGGEPAEETFCHRTL